MAILGIHVSFRWCISSKLKQVSFHHELMLNYSHLWKDSQKQHATSANFMCVLFVKGHHQHVISNFWLQKSLGRILISSINSKNMYLWLINLLPQHTPQKWGFNKALLRETKGIVSGGVHWEGFGWPVMMYQVSWNCWGTAIKLSVKHFLLTNHWDCLVNPGKLTTKPQKYWFKRWFSSGGVYVWEMLGEPEVFPPPSHLSIGRGRSAPRGSSHWSDPPSWLHVPKKHQGKGDLIFFRTK